MSVRRPIIPLAKAAHVLPYRPAQRRYDPWRDLRQNWPDVDLIVEPMEGDLLGEVRDGGRTIALRAGTSTGQRRCTLTHEIVHLERGLFECGPFEQREEQLVHAEVAHRLIPVDVLAEAIRFLGGDGDSGALALLLDVDSETLDLRRRLLDRLDRRAMRRVLSAQVALWSVA
ncbi:hypothetical protein ACSMXN_19500 [Jatrophihabitans sp. DSM 45814]